MNAHLAKPIDLATVIATLRTLPHGPAYAPLAIAPTSSLTLEPLTVLLARFGGKRRLLASLAARFGPQAQALLTDLSHAVAGGDHGGTGTPQPEGVGWQFRSLLAQPKGR